MKHAVVIKDVSFKYAGQDRYGIRDFNLTIEKGDRFGLFGPNGAGKTTLMSLMVGLLNPIAGQVFLDGYEVNKNKNKIASLMGFVPQDFAFYNELSPIENMNFFGAWYGLTKSEIKSKSLELLEILGLTDVMHKPVHTFSGGMKRRVNLAIGVMHKPSILFLDEPTVGVDMQSRFAIIQYLKQINDEGTTLVYTSHHLKEAEDLCSSVAMIDYGQLIGHYQMDQLPEEFVDGGLESMFLSLTGHEFRD
jgi:ABC-2 type transport system ATP-binding protein